MDTNRVEINDEMLESIVGGAYVYYEAPDGTMKLKITDGDYSGTVLAKYVGNAYMKFDIDKIKAAHMDWDWQQVMNYAMTPKAQGGAGLDIRKVG